MILLGILYQFSYVGFLKKHFRLACRHPFERSGRVSRPPSAKHGEVQEGEFFHAALWVMRQEISMPPAYDSSALQASQSCPFFRPAA